MATDWLDPAAFGGTQITEISNDEQIQAALLDHKRMLLCVLDAILRRYERSPGYGFIDTKLSLVTGRDFQDDDPIRGRKVIYGWIQGRGLEALAGHCNWLDQDRQIDDSLRWDLQLRTKRVIAEVLDHMEQLRAANGGRLSFMMTPEGRPLKVGPDGRGIPHELPQGLPTSVSDMFYCKGMAAAARVLGDTARLQEACNLFHEIYKDVLAGRYYSDQQPMDPRNPVAPVPGRFGHGSRMIGIGAAACFLECTGDPAYTAVGLEFIDYVLSRHVNSRGPTTYGVPFDMWEFNDAQGRPFVEDGMLRSDPGHATEFVGLALKLIAKSEELCTIPESEYQRIERFKLNLPEVLKRNFANGLSPRGLGVCKAYDLIGRKPINDQMPWWNLPETLRGAVLAMKIARTEELQMELAQIAAVASNAFFRHFVRKELGLMAAQTLDPDGQVVDVIPATPDADPGYHTGLSVIDAIKAMEAGPN